MDNNALTTTLEKLPLAIYNDKHEGSAFVAKEIAAIIKDNNSQNKSTVIGLATGSSPLFVYEELIRIHREEGLSFKNVISFNLDEYYPIQKEDKQSYNHFMYENLFSHLDINPENIFIPDGSISPAEISKSCQEYEQKIESFGGIDVQLLGIGRSGHIGFNEPGSTNATTTRLVSLHELTIEDAILDFGKEEDVPVRAITVGIKTILKARKIFMIAWGEAKADILQRVVEGPTDARVPASYLQLHHDVSVIADRWAASYLSRIKAPWLIGFSNWDNSLKKKALIWLSKKAKKPILKLTDADYKKWGLTDLLKAGGSAYRLNIEVYNQVQQTITGWPGGKPKADDKARPERTTPFPKKVIVFSPHPDDDVISMGGTLQRLVEQGHEVHVAYQTSGNIAVFDDDALRFVDFIVGFAQQFNIEQESIQKIYDEVRNFLKNKTVETPDSQMVLKIKGLIRRGEAAAACRYCSVDEEFIHYLDMPFYQTASIIKKPLGEEDIDIVVNLLDRVKPHQIFAAGDLQDPHGTHAVCLQSIFKAIERLKDEPWMEDCYVWLYRGAWQEWNVEDIEMAVPISPEELLKKRKAIFKHQSQKDSPVFPGKDKREFWQRAEDRNRTTARFFDELGLTEYEAIEAFVRWKF